MNARILVLAVTLALVADSGYAGRRRSSTERLRFVHTHACPATHEFKLPCPGYIIDHVKALCAGGADKASNMQWQTVEAAKAKDRWECSR